MQPARCLCTVHTSRPGDQGRGLGACLAGPLHRRPRASKEPAHAGLAPTLHRRPRASPPRPRLLGDSPPRASKSQPTPRPPALKHLALKHQGLGAQAPGHAAPLRLHLCLPQPPFPFSESTKSPAAPPHASGGCLRWRRGRWDGGWRMEDGGHPPSSIHQTSSIACALPPALSQEEGTKEEPSLPSPHPLPCLRCPLCCAG